VGESRSLIIPILVQLDQHLNNFFTGKEEEFLLLGEVLRIYTALEPYSKMIELAMNEATLLLKPIFLTF
jgi:hypothetical protein